MKMHAVNSSNDNKQDSKETDKGFRSSDEHLPSGGFLVGPPMTRVEDYYFSIVVHGSRAVHQIQPQRLK